MAPFQLMLDFGSEKRSKRDSSLAQTAGSSSFMLCYYEIAFYSNLKTKFRFNQCPQTTPSGASDARIEQSDLHQFNHIVVISY